MGEEKSNKGLVWLIVILIILVLGLIGYIVYDKALKDNNESSNNSNTTTTIITTENIESNNNEDTNYPKKDMVLDFEKAKKDNRLNFNDRRGNVLLADLTENKYNINLTIENISLNSKKHFLKVVNYKPNDYDCEKGIEKVIYFDNEVIYEPEGEGCYLSGLEDILVYQNKYVIIVFMYQNGGWIDVFDEDGKRLKTNIDMTVSSIEQINENNITIIGWPDNNEELSCKDNEYELKIEDGIINYSLINVGTNENCI